MQYLSVIASIPQNIGCTQYSECPYPLGFLSNISKLILLIFTKHCGVQEYYRQRWPALDVPAELAKRVICACICEICFFRDFMGHKRRKVSWSSLARYLYTRQLACEPQTGSLAYFSVAIRNRTKKTTSSLNRSSTSSNMQAAAFAVPLCKNKQC